CVLVARDLVDALAELGIGVGRETGADAAVRRRKRLAAILAEVVTAGRDAEVHALAFAQDGVHAEPAVAGVPFACVLVVADAGDQLQGTAAIAAAEERRRPDAAPEVLLVVARLERPDVGEGATVLLGEGRRGLRLLELLAEIGRVQDLHAEEGIATGGIEAG